jgi:hypothetical protein
MLGAFFRVPQIVPRGASLAELRWVDLGLLELACFQRVRVADYLGLLCLVTANGDFARGASLGINTGSAQQAALTKM